MAANIAKTHMKGRYFAQCSASRLQWPHALAVKPGAL
jgi:hypothetical protein